MSLVSLAPTPGVCQVCGCTDLQPCELVNALKERGVCSWVDPERTLCSNSLCVAKIPLDQLLVMVRQFEFEPPGPMQIRTGQKKGKGP